MPHRRTRGGESSWFQTANDDATTFWFRDLIRMGIFPEAWGRQRVPGPRYKPWWFRGERKGHTVVLIATEIGFISAIIGLIVGLHMNYLGPIIFAVGIILLVPAGFWLIWEFNMATRADRRERQRREEEEEEEGEEEEDADDEGEGPVAERRSRDGAREDLPSVRDGGQIQVVVPSPPPYEEVTSQDRRHLGDQNEASTPRPPPYASVAEVDERTTRQQQQQQQSSRSEEPRNSEQCPSYTEAIRSPTSRSPAEEMPSELPPVPPPAYEEVVNR
ncbi:PREDICTED: apoptotic chromatin condensation inducer in the nucleus-like [Branchiostoma belcheri]|uniref:Apoptotic chromatin condensation inducer in the nucleus-like n=1 Tax=Branchiostoma belcheri TaxID=7741 RepID=A0A6P5ASA6_BRABE|nr:PREDICTED: apoptotic chromatin condensation inducer in the nucleus-like [Branchiostoma belcheri]